MKEREELSFTGDEKEDYDLKINNIDAIKERIFDETGCEEVLLKIFFPKDSLRKILFCSLSNSEKVFLIKFMTDNPSVFNYETLSELYNISVLEISTIFENLIKEEIIVLLDVNPKTNKQNLKVCFENMKQESKNIE